MNIWQEYARRYIPEQNYPDLWTRSNQLPWLPDTKIFADRLRKALEQGEKICIYSDYDTDAVTATFVMYKGLLILGFKEEQISYYAPDRFTEGYGMNTKAIEMLAKTNDLIISVDCGINSTVEAEIVKHSSADLIITDHHHLNAEIPQALGVINPRLNEYYLQHQDVFEKRGNNKEDVVVHQNDFLSASVTGVGVSWFSVVWVAHHWNIEHKAGIDLKKFEWLLPVVAIGTIADCQSIIDSQNRVLVKVALNILNTYPRNVPGLQSLLQTTGLLDKIDNGYVVNSQDFAFTFSPILNSSGRLTHAQLSIDVLVKDEIGQAKELTQINEDRKLMVKETVASLDQQAADQIIQGKEYIWLEGPWSKGLIGLLASRIQDAHQVPTAVLSVFPDEEKVTASLRAPEGYHWPNILDNVGEGLLDGYGGHPQAAGFKTSPDRLQKIREDVEKHIVHPENTQQKLWSHAEVPESLEGLKYRQDTVILQRTPTMEELAGVWNLGPFGQDFPFPKILFPLKPGSIRWLSENKHVKLSVDGIQLLWFNLTTENRDVIRSWEAGEQAWVLGKATQNAWRGVLRSECIIDKGWLV